jgi:N-acylneuraminate cytidylyltransferase
MPIEYESPRQALAPAYRHDGGHAIANLSTFLVSQKFLGPRTLPFPVPLEEAVDVNQAIDLAWAEFLLQQGMVNN